MEILLIFASPVQCGRPAYIVVTQYLRGDGTDLSQPSPSIVKAELKAATGPDQPDNQQQYDGADRRIDDFRQQAGADRDAEFRKQEAREQRAGDTDDDVADDAKAGAAHDLAGQPAGDQADEQNDNQTFVRNMHENSPGFMRVVTPALAGK